MTHLVLLGDSVFANAAYVAGGPDVVSQVRRRLPEGWSVSLRAGDKVLLGDVPAQLQDLPEGAGGLIVSAGRDDALRHIDVVREGANSTLEVLNKLAYLADRFQLDYHNMLAAVLDCGLPTGVCTINNPRYRNPLIRRLAAVLVALFDDCIVREAHAAGLPLIDLRVVCGEDDDYVNSAEPSPQGGEKIAAAIERLVRGELFRAGGAA
ncbi:MAG TPA: hypothetical protein VF521_13105 [Pyrinomonadaceae bacterium]|jgi:hypothetical protein